MALLPQHVSTSDKGGVFKLVVTAKNLREAGILLRLLEFFESSDVNFTLQQTHHPLKSASSQIIHPLRCGESTIAKRHRLFFRKAAPLEYNIQY